MHSLIDSCIFSDWGPNLQPWHIGTMLQPTELSGQSFISFMTMLFASVFWITFGFYQVAPSRGLLKAQGWSADSHIQAPRGEW